MGVGSDSFGMIEAHCVYCALYSFYQYISSTSDYQPSDQRLKTPALGHPSTSPHLGFRFYLNSYNHNLSCLFGKVTQEEHFIRLCSVESSLLSKEVKLPQLIDWHVFPSGNCRSQILSFTVQSKVKPVSCSCPESSPGSCGFALLGTLVTSVLGV